MIDVFGTDACLAQRSVNGTGQSRLTGGHFWIGDAGVDRGIERGTEADYFGINPCPAFLSMRQILHDQDAAAFAQDETVAATVEGPAGPFRFLVVTRKGV